MGLQQRPSTPRARGRQPALGTWPPGRAARSSCSACCSAGCGYVGPMMRVEGALQRLPYHEVCAGFAEQLLSSTSGCSIVSEFAALWPLPCFHHEQDVNVHTQQCSGTGKSSLPSYMM